MIKKMSFLFSVLFVSMGLAACTSQQEVVNEKPPVSKPDGENPSNPKGPVSEEPEEEVYHNEVFKDVVVTEKADIILVKGKAQVFEGVFQYALYNGEKVVKEGNYQTEGAPAWGEFEITFAKELLSANTSKLELFVYSAKDGSKINTLEIPIALDN